ncbi:hypothetical protein [Saccharopolyspora thermophila]|uniref:hypothetical protein n=1 Tax=Saccharopolyspora thermophila TaxID=89367 RepID=UPI00166E7DE4|nr:hypothetical protein [Saccharopolyspora subtropica]
MAIVLLLQVALLWADRAELPQRLVERQVAPAEAAARAHHLLLVNTGVAVVFAAAYLGFGALLFRRRAWARNAVSVFALVHLVMLLATGAVFGVHAVLLVLGVAAGVLLWRRASTDWLTGER